MNVLIVDDEEMVRESLRDFLFYFLPGKFNIFIAENGQEALELIQKRDLNFSILITDFNMPKMNGVDLIRSVLALKIQLKKIVLVSGRERNELQIEDLLSAHSHFCYLKKPFEGQTFISLMKVIE